MENDICAFDRCTDPSLETCIPKVFDVHSLPQDYFNETRYIVLIQHNTNACQNGSNYKLYEGIINNVCPSIRSTAG